MIQYKYEYYYSGINPVEFQGHMINKKTNKYLLHYDPSKSYLSNRLERPLVFELIDTGTLRLAINLTLGSWSLAPSPSDPDSVDYEA